MEKEKTGWSKLNPKKDKVRNNRGSWEGKTKKHGCYNPWELIVIAQIVSDSHQSDQRTQASELISQTLCAVNTYIIPFNSLHRNSQFFMAALAWGKREAGIELRCHYICMERNYFLDWGEWKSWPDLHYTAFKRMGGLFSHGHWFQKECVIVWVRRGESK